ncbi:hypothetical protein C0991_012169 [Blastosporella zonata]|nr:hypothetical protein C0991_012169 [Blastosporella zonata]
MFPIRLPHIRTFATKNATGPPKAYNKNALKAIQEASGKANKDKVKGPLRGTDIRHRVVRLVDPETSKLTEPRRLQSILASINHASHYVELVTETPEPIVKIFDRYLETTRAAEAAFRAREVARQNVTKEVQVTWGAAPADLAHKVGKVREELARGARVSFVFSRKSGQAKLTPWEMESRALEIMEGLKDVAKEWRPREVRGGEGILAIHLEATGTTTAEETSSATAEGETTDPEGPSKKFVLYPDSMATDSSHIVRRVRRDLAKGARVEVVLSAKSLRPPNDGQEEPLTVDELQARAADFIKNVVDVAKEWKEREYKPVSAKLIVFLERQGGRPKGRAVVHKGPKPKKAKPGDFPDLFQD